MARGAAGRDRRAGRGIRAGPAGAPRGGRGAAPPLPGALRRLVPAGAPAVALAAKAAPGASHCSRLLAAGAGPAQLWCHAALRRFSCWTPLQPARPPRSLPPSQPGPLHPSQVVDLIEGADPLAITEHPQLYRLPEACEVGRGGQAWRVPGGGGCQWRQVWALSGRDAQVDGAACAPVSYPEPARCCARLLALHTRRCGGAGA